MELKQVVITERKVGLVSVPLARYPDSPDELDPQLYSAAYPSEEPVIMEISGINALANRVSLRKNNHKLQNSKIPLLENLDFSC